MSAKSIRFDIMVSALSLSPRRSPYWKGRRTKWTSASPASSFPLLPASTGMAVSSTSALPAYSSASLPALIWTPPRFSLYGECSGRGWLGSECSRQNVCLERCPLYHANLHGEKYYMPDPKYLTFICTVMQRRMSSKCLTLLLFQMPHTSLNSGMETG